MRILTSVLLGVFVGSPAVGAAGEPGVILIHAGFGTPRGFEVRGRVLEGEGDPEPDRKRSRWSNLVHSAKTFETDEIVGIGVNVTVGGVSYTARTDDDGVWRVVARDLPVPLPSGEVPLTVRIASKTELEIPEVRGAITIVGDEPGVAVISDVDDTILDSRVADKARLVFRTLTRNAAQLEPVAGVAAAYRNARQAGARAFFYVSGSPQNLYERIAEFLRLRDIPAGPILLKNFGEDPLFEQEAYKLARISHLMKTFPQLRFILIGDSGEKDPEVYRAIANEFPGRVARTIIRRVQGADNSDGRLAGMEAIDDYVASAEVIARWVLGGSK